jgi:hypothetical protein
MLSKIIRRAGRHTRRHTHVTISCYYIKTYAINRSRFESLSAHRTGPTLCRACSRLVRRSDGSACYLHDVLSYRTRSATPHVCPEEERVCRHRAGRVSLSADRDLGWHTPAAGTARLIDVIRSGVARPPCAPVR